MYRLRHFYKRRKYFLPRRPCKKPSEVTTVPSRAAPSCRERAVTPSPAGVSWSWVSSRLFRDSTNACAINNPCNELLEQLNFNWVTQEITRKLSAFLYVSCLRDMQVNLRNIERRQPGDNIICEQKKLDWFRQIRIKIWKSSSCSSAQGKGVRYDTKSCRRNNELRASQLGRGTRQEQENQSGGTGPPEGRWPVGRGKRIYKVREHFQKPRWITSHLRSNETEIWWIKLPDLQIKVWAQHKGRTKVCKLLGCRIWRDERCHTQ